MKMKVKSLSVRLFATPWTAAQQAPLPMGFSKKSHAIPLVGLYPEETKIEEDTRIPLFIATLFTIARTWKEPRCLSTDEWINKLWYVYTMEYYSAINRNKFQSVPMKWMNLEPITQSEVNQKEKDKYILTHIYGV